MQLRRAGMRVEALVSEGDFIKRIIEHAETWDADCVFLGSGDLGCGRSAGPGSVALAVAAGAPCSVEIVRGPIDPNQPVPANN